MSANGVDIKLSFDARESWKKVHSLEMMIDQREAVLRRSNVPEHYFGEPDVILRRAQRFLVRENSSEDIENSLSSVW